MGQNHEPRRASSPASTPSLLVLVLLIIPLAGCHPYYNTFYNAKEAYNSARRKHVKIERVFPDSLAVTSTEEMIALYDRSVEKSLKMMEVFPRDRKHQDRAHFLMGRAAFYKQDFPVCLGRVSDLQSLHPKSPLVPPAMIYAAKSHIMMDNLAVAEEILLGLLRDYPLLDRNQEITMLLIEIAMRRGGRSQALGLLDGIKLSALPLEKRIDIILRMADLHYELRQYQIALNMLRNAPRSNKHPFLMYRIDRLIYFCLDATDSLNDALDHLSAMQKNRRYTDQKYEILYYRAVTLRRMGRFNEAIALLEEIEKMCVRIGTRTGAATLCGRTSYELALIYQEQGEFDKAEAGFEAASKVKGLPTSDKASMRLWALRRLRELRQPDSAGNIPAEARYLIAELFRFELESPDSAYFYYAELTTDAAAADSLRPRALLSAAVVARHMLGDTARADSLLKTVISGYEGTEYARRAQIEMDIEVTVVTARELAERKFRDAEALLENEPMEAVKAFYNVFVEYPDIDMAPKSLHAAAWYTDNTLQRNRAAMTLYEELCEKYPESVYCTKSAKPRLTVARDSIEVRRQRRDAARAEAEAAGIAPPAAIDEIDPEPEAKPEINPEPANNPRK